MNYLESLLNMGEFVLLVGGPGCAKTARLRAAAQATGRRLFYGIGGRTADLMDRLDAAGAIVPNIAEGVSETLPLRALNDIMQFQGKAVWFIDEIGRAPLDVQGALCSQIDVVKREKPDMTVCAATNRPQDAAGVHAISEQLRSRFSCAFAIATPADRGESTDVSYLLPWHAEPGHASELGGWCDYAVAEGFAPEIIAWHRATTGRTLYAWQPSKNAAQRFPDYRTWETVNRFMRHGHRDMHTLGAVVGKATAAEFTAFAAMGSEIPTPDDVRKAPQTCQVPDDTNPAALFLICSMLADAVKPEWIGQCLMYMERLPRIFVAYLGRDLFKRHGEAFAREPKWLQWLTKNQALFNVG